MSWWNELRLEQLDEAQWEALCDGCAKCCLHKLQDEQTDEFFLPKSDASISMNRRAPARATRSAR